MQQRQRITIADHHQAASQCNGDAAQLHRCHPLLPRQPRKERDRNRIERNDERPAPGRDVAEPVKETQGVEKNAGDRQPADDAPLAPVGRAWNSAFGGQRKASQHNSGNEETEGGSHQRCRHFLRHDAPRDPGSAPHEHGTGELEIGSRSCGQRSTDQNISTASAVASPPPMQSDATPRFRPYFFSAPSSVTTMRAPEAPIG